MPLFLVLDTSTKNCAVAIAENNTVLSQKIVEDTQSHAKLLPTLIKEALEEVSLKIQDIDTLIVSEGPGSYTGLRIGFATAKAIAYTLNKPILFVDALEALAVEMANRTKEKNAYYIATMPSRKGELYYAIANENSEIIKGSTPAKFTNTLFEEYENKKIFLAGNNNETVKKYDFKNKFVFLCLEFNVKYLLNYAIKGSNYTGKENYIYKNPKYLKPFGG